MSVINEQTIRTALAQVRYPGFSRDIISFGLVKEIKIDASANVMVQMALATSDTKIPAAIKTESEAALRALAGIGTVQIRIDVQAPPQAAGSGRGGQKTRHAVERCEFAQARWQALHREAAAALCWKRNDTHVRER